MFTLPDGPDALTALPPFGPVGPHPSGFFADCNTNPPGTIPVADDFNELIVNLRALLAKGLITPVKGDPTMLWRAIFGLTIIQTAVSLYVTPTGTPNPVNPWGGDPFGQIQDALTFLANYRITSGGSVTIHVAAGTYVMPGPVYLDHPSGVHIAIIGAGPTNTLLQFSTQPALSGGFTLTSGAFGTVQEVGLIGAGWTGQGNQQKYGIMTQGQLNIHDVSVQNFDGHGFYAGSGGALAITGTATANNNNFWGFAASQNGTIFSDYTNVTITAQNNTAGGVGVTGGRVLLTGVTISGGQHGISLMMGAVGWFGPLNVGAVSIPSQAIQVDSQSGMFSSGLAGANQWQTAAGQSFVATNMSLINAGTALATANRPNCSPAVNTIGNINSYILTS